MRMERTYKRLISSLQDQLADAQAQLRAYQAPRQERWQALRASRPDLRLAPQCWKLLEALRSGHTVPNETLQQNIRPHYSDVPSLDPTVKVAVSRARKAGFVITNIFGEGYRLENPEHLLPPNDSTRSK